MIYIAVVLFLIIVIYSIHQTLPNLTFYTAASVVVHFAVTSPSNIYHTLMDRYNRYITKKYDNSPLQNKNVIIFVHGRNGHHADMLPLINNLNDISQKSNNEKYYLRMVNLGPTADTLIEEDVCTLKNALETYINCNIILVGLSKGGVTVSTYFLIMNDERIKGAITISSPVMGTEVANAFERNSNVNKGLGRNNTLALSMNEKAKNKSIYHIVPTWDHLIIPSHAAYYPNTHDDNIYYYTKMSYGHSGICYDPDVAKKIEEWIKII